MKTRRTRCYEVTTDDGHMRHGFVVEYHTPFDQRRWMGIVLDANLPETHARVLPQSFVNAVTAAHEVALEDSRSNQRAAAVAAEADRG